MLVCQACIRLREQTAVTVNATLALWAWPTATYQQQHLLLCHRSVRLLGQPRRHLVLLLAPLLWQLTLLQGRLLLVLLAVVSWCC
jgi:hypothetical protein